MKLGIQNWIVESYPDEIKIEMIAKAGFDSIDWDFFNLYLGRPGCKQIENDSRSYYTNLKTCLDKNNITVSQTHSPFPTHQKTILGNRRIAHALRLSVMATSILGAKYTIIHPHMPIKYSNFKYRSERIKKNIIFYKSLIPLLEEFDVTCCIENMYSWNIESNSACETSCYNAGEMKEVLKGIDHPRFKFCFDSGHANMITGTSNIHGEILALGSDIAALHLHDNNGKYDYHQPIGTGTVDWTKLMDTLYRVGFDSDYSFELKPYILGRDKSKHQERLNALHDSLRSFLHEHEQRRLNIK